MEFTSYKAAGAGGRIVKVDPRHSSNECHRCGVRTSTPIAALFTCDCGIAMNRDHNAAPVILKRSVMVPNVAAAKVVQA